MTASWQKHLDSVLGRRTDEIRDIRRHLHANPEPSGEEFKTSLYLYQQLADEGFSVWMGPEGCGVVVDDLSIQADEAPPRIAIRADIDALRIHDQKTTEYRSRNEGIMHACGHDAHTAVVWGALAALREMSLEGTLPWPVRLRGIFQPAEETCAGAKLMIEAGALEDVGAIVACHVDPTRRRGRIGLRAGLLTANCDDMLLKVTGRGGHAARPHETIDPIAAALQLTNSLYLYIPRRTDSQDAVVVTVGQVLGGHNPNVIPEEVELRGTLRTLNHRVREATIEHIRRIAAGIAQASETQITVDFWTAADSVVNDSGIVALMRTATEEVLGPESVEDIPRPSMGSEDFAYYLQHVPGAMMRLGVGWEGNASPGLHKPDFDIDENALLVGARILARTAVLWSDPSRRPPSH